MKGNPDLHNPAHAKRSHIGIIFLFLEKEYKMLLRKIIAAKVIYRE